MRNSEPSADEVAGLRSRSYVVGESALYGFADSSDLYEFADNPSFKEENVADEINPDHYRRFPVEVIEITQHLNFCKGNAVKYLCRAGHKDGADELTDLAKAEWYIQREIARAKGEREREVHVK